MSQFECLVANVDSVTPHPNADRLELLSVCGYTTISQKGLYTVGDKVVYIPASAIVPDSILEELDLKGSNALKTYNGRRCVIKPIRLRGTFSEGIVYKPENVDSFDVGTDVSQLLGIEKYVPTLPKHLSGFCRPTGPFHNKIPKFDVEPIQKNKDLFTEGEEVVITSKLHGTLFHCGFVTDEDGNRNFFVTSKGLGNRGIVLDHENEANVNNLYVNEFLKKRGNKQRSLLDVLQSAPPLLESLSLFGEIVGPGVQDLTYGLTEPKLFLFAKHVKFFTNKEGFWCSPLQLQTFTLIINSLTEAIGDDALRRVPVVYHGPFSLEKVYELTNGKETISGKGLHVNEGVVVQSMVCAFNEKGKRLLLKSVSEDYKTRGGSVTEFE